MLLLPRAGTAVRLLESKTGRLSGFKSVISFCMNQVLQVHGGENFHLRLLESIHPLRVLQKLSCSLLILCLSIRHLIRDLGHDKKVLNQIHAFA